MVSAAPVSAAQTGVLNAEGPHRFPGADLLSVRPKGFEPLTFCSVDRRSIQLSYGRILGSLGVSRSPEPRITLREMGPEFQIGNPVIWPTRPVYVTLITKYPPCGVIKP